MLACELPVVHESFRLVPVGVEVSGATSDKKKPPKKKKPPPPPQSELLVRLAEQAFEFGQDDTGEPFAVEHGGPALALPLRGDGGLRMHLVAQYRRRCGGRDG